MNRPLVQAGAGISAFVILGTASILLTNALFNVMASGKPSVTFSIVSDTPPAVSATASPLKPPTGVRIAHRQPY